MVMQPTYGYGFDDSPTIEISQEGLRSILNQIEAELTDSEVFRRTMAGLQTMMGEAFNTAQILVKAVGREAIRLTFQEFTRQYKIVPVTAPRNNHSNEEKEEEIELAQQAQEDFVKVQNQSHTTLETTVSNRVETTKQPDLVTRPIGDTKQRKKPTKAELAAQKFAQEREELLRQVGQELRQARQARSLSIEQLYRQTLVPTHQIEALEAGRIDQLPEDVYIRGFIRRLSQALGLNGVAIASSLPTPDPVKSVVPSWYHEASEFGFQLNSIHLYLGYAALIAGAVGGLNWMAHQSTSGASVEPEPVNSHQTPLSAKTEKAELKNKPGVKSAKTGVKAGPDIAPPEALPF